MEFLLCSCDMNAIQKHIVLIVLSAISILIAVSLDPIPQNPAYHDFADRRPMWGIQNAGDVLSNIGYLVTGFLGVWILGLRYKAMRSVSLCDPTWNCYFVFFLGILASSLGSAYYHLDPDNVSLFWDRLPMTFAFMGLLSSVLIERVHEDIGRRLLWPLILFGVFSVLYWSWTEAQGKGDLRLYGLVQGLPMLLIPVIFILYRSRFDDGKYYLGLIVGYGLAKFFEFLDKPILELGHIASGHTLKHLSAAAGVTCVTVMVGRRKVD